MRIDIQGPSRSVGALAGLLTKAGYLVTANHAHYTIVLEDASGVQPYITVDAIDGEIEANVVRHICQRTEIPVLLQRAGGILTHRAIRVVIPPSERDKVAVAVEEGIMCGMMATIGTSTEQGVFKRLAARFKRGGK